MLKFPFFLFTAILLLLSSPVKAETFIINPFVKGSFAEIKRQHQNKPFVLIFWSETCAYCMKELSMFGKLSKQYPGIDLVTVATDPFLQEATVKDVLSRSQLHLRQAWVFAERFPERLYAEINKRWRGELPATHFFTRNNQEIPHMGMIREAELIKWMSEQSSLN